MPAVRPRRVEEPARSLPVRAEVDAAVPVYRELPVLRQRVHRLVERPGLAPAGAGPIGHPDVLLRGRAGGSRQRPPGHVIEALAVGGHQRHVVHRAASEHRELGIRPPAIHATAHHRSAGAVAGRRRRDHLRPVRFAAVRRECDRAVEFEVAADDAGGEDLRVGTGRRLAQVVAGEGGEVRRRLVGAPRCQEFRDTGALVLDRDIPGTLAEAVSAVRIGSLAEQEADRLLSRHECGVVERCPAVAVCLVDIGCGGEQPFQDADGPAGCGVVQQ